MKKSPSEESPIPVPVPAVNVNKTAPVAPIRIPTERLNVIASLRMKKERTTTRIGLIVIIIPVLTGDVRLKP